METRTQIKQNLKKLRLASFYDNFEQRIEEALQTKMSYDDFLLLLTQDEVDRRKQKKQENSIRRSGLGRYKRLLEFDFDFNPKIDKQRIFKLAGCEFISRRENIILAEPAGVGKTFLAKAIAHEACVKGYSVLFTRVFKMLEEIYAANADNSVQKKLKQYIKADLLVLDDWGLQAFPNHLLHFLNEVISERYDNGSIIITSNRPVNKWNELFDEPVVSSALLDRLFHNAHNIEVTGNTYRRMI
jgi:DNA replication protein DnaC